MSDFRIFCIAYFVAHGVIAAGINRGFIQGDKFGDLGTLISLSVVLAAGAVALFGGRKSKEPTQ